VNVHILFNFLKIYYLQFDRKLFKSLDILNNLCLIYFWNVICLWNNVLYCSNGILLKYKQGQFDPAAKAKLKISISFYYKNKSNEGGFYYV